MPAIAAVVRKLVMIFAAGAVAAGLARPLEGDDARGVGEEGEVADFEHHIEPHRAVVRIAGFAVELEAGGLNSRTRSDRAACGLSSHTRRHVLPFDVDEQHRDDRDDVPPWSRGTVRAWTRAEGRYPISALRDGDDARHIVCRDDRRHGHAGRHTAEPDRRRSVAHDGRHQRVVYRMDVGRRPDRRGHHGLARPLVSRAEVSRHQARPRDGAHRLGRAAQAGIDDERRAQCRIRVFGDGRVVDIAGVFSLALGETHPATRRFSTLFPESVAAIVGALLLLVIPVSWRERRFTLSWAEASRIDWGIVLLFGGGLAMGRLSDSTGLSAALGHGIAARFPDAGVVGLTMVFTAIAVVMSETASNTAAANIIVPTAIAVSQAAGISPLEPALGATIGASLGFMMPISTPPNAIVYSSGYIPLRAMVRNGLVLDIVGYFIVVAGVLGLSGLLR